VDLKQITKFDKVWKTDITSIPLQKGFRYLVAVVDLFSSHVYSFGEGFAYSWKLSNSLDAEFCLEALEIALASGYKPIIIYSDQGCQFISGDVVARLKAEGNTISGSARKLCFDSILVERLWRTVTYVDEGCSAKPSGGVPACLKRWMGG
jgi:putative transposase